MTGWACYGLRIVGIDGAARYLYPATDEPTLTVRQQAGFTGPRGEEELTEDSAQLHLSDGTGIVRLDRASSTATLLVREAYPDEALLHPMLSSTTAVLSRWLGRDSFHAGVFVLGGQAWVLTGDKGHGKSTTLGYLARHAVRVLADDLAVESGGRIFTGPGFVDLRTEAAAALGGGRDLGILGARARTRLDLGDIDEPVQASYPLGGWIQLAWGDELTLAPVPLAERLGLLFRNSAVQRPPVDPSSYLRHAAKPFYRLTRPHDLTGLPAVMDLLRSSLA